MVHKPDGNIRLTLHFTSNGEGKLTSQKIIGKEVEGAGSTAAAPAPKPKSADPSEATPAAGATAVMTCEALVQRYLDLRFAGKD